MIKNLLVKLRDRLLTRWVSCKVISDKKSVLYGVHFSYPAYLLVVILGIILINPYILSIAALIAFFAIKLPMHPLDYVYNYGAAKLIGTNKIPGRGSELQVNSIIALLFSLVVLVFMISGISINFGALAIIYTLSSIFFIAIFLFKG